jgi:3-oxoadipate enol-lactonase
MWDAVAPVLSRHFRFVRYDARGHGRSVTVDRPTSMDELARDALGVLDALGVETAHFLGLSMGGMVGQRLLATAPRRLERVALANTAGRMGPPAVWNERIRLVERQGVEALSGAVMGRWFTPGFHASRPETVAAVAETFARTSAQGYASCCAAIRDMDQLWSLREAANETLVIVGAQDASTTPDAGRALASALPNARLATLEAAHLSCVEASEAFAQLVLAFLTAPPRSRAVSPAKPAPRSPKVALATRGGGRRVKDYRPDAQTVGAPPIRARSGAKRAARPTGTRLTEGSPTDARQADAPRAAAPGRDAKAARRVVSEPSKRTASKTSASAATTKSRRSAAGTKQATAPKAKTASASQTKSLAKTDAQPAAKMGSKAKTKANAKPAPKANVKSAAKTNAKPAAKANAKPAAKANAKSAAKTNAKPAPKANAKSAAKTNAKSVTKTNAKPAAKANAKPAAKTNAKSATKAAVKSKRESQPATPRKR